MPEVGSFKASVVDTKTNLPFPEFKVTEGDGKVDCYIQSEPDSQFKLSFGFTPLFDQVNKTFFARLRIDGKELRTGTGLGGKYGRQGQREGMDITESQIVPFAFGNTLFTENVGNTDAATLSGLGTIVVEFWEVEHLMLQRMSIDPDAKTIAAEKKTINEKRKKALITHSVSYGNPIDVTVTNFWAVKFVSNTPVATVTFNYRSREILEAMEIVPRNPIAARTPTPNPDLSGEESGSDEEAESNAGTKIQKLKAEIQMLKRKIKHEPLTPEVLDLTSGEVRKRRKVVVDLTESD